MTPVAELQIQAWLRRRADARQEINRLIDRDARLSRLTAEISAAKARTH